MSYTMDFPVVIGVLGVIARRSNLNWLRALAIGFVELIRNTPLLVQIFVVYYGVALIGLNVDAWIAVAIAFTLHAIAKAGFSGVEIFENDFLTHDASPREVAEMLKDHGLSVPIPSRADIPLE